ncbi:hypothetical protein SETIT_5G468200v2 [Setaria italica]|uniref:Uncharacterized protein n=1 Tax=Setaria italica TaxID=4555 RepID=A0A368RGA3_SETIT|nr:hypothetical protein SETIT_5G468200v2 [Setaria italica]
MEYLVSGVWVEVFCFFGDLASVMCLLIDSRMLHPTSHFIAAAEVSGDSSIIHLSCCLDSWTALRSFIIILATVESLFIPFVLSSITYCLLVTFWMLLGMVFHAQMIDVADFNHKIMACSIILPLVELLLTL